MTIFFIIIKQITIIKKIRKANKVKIITIREAGYNPSKRTTSNVCKILKKLPKELYKKYHIRVDKDKKKTKSTRRQTKDKLRSQLKLVTRLENRSEGSHTAAIRLAKFFPGSGIQLTKSTLTANLGSFKAPL